MQRRTKSYDSLVAPSPIVPTCRSSSSTSRTGRYTMSPLSQEVRAESPALMLSDSKSDQMTDFLKYIETPSGAPQSTGARDIFRAGQRRLRQLAQRPRKNLDPKSKAEETARQLMALQEGGFLPSHVALSPKLAPKRSSHKQSLDSSRSSSRSISNLSFKSSSRRDVESIGQPWLSDPLEKKDKPDTQASHPSSLDLRELTSMVEAAVSCPAQPDDIDPPPYRPVEISEQSASRPNENRTSTLNPPSDQNTRRIEGIEEGDTAASRPDTDAPGQSADSRRSSTESKASASGPVLASTQNTQTQPPPTLKLFPDTLPPRVSSKGAWRISGGRPAAPGGALPLAPAQRAMIEPVSECTKLEADSTSTERQPSTAPDNRNKGTSGEPQGKEDTDSSKSEPPKKSCRRPSSLPMCAIDAFPIPAPMRPLPSLPEMGPTVTVHERTTSARPASSTRLMLVGKRSTAENDIEIIGEINSEPAGFASNALGPNTLVRTGPNRAERVMALKKRDVTTGRLYLNGLDPPEEGNEEEQPADALTPEPETSRDDENISDARKNIEHQPDCNKRYQRIVASEPPSPPPRSPPPMNPARHSTGQAGRQFPASSKKWDQGFSEELELQSRLNKTTGVQRSGSVHSSSTQERLAKEKSLKVRSESPLPSSDDDCTGASKRTRPAAGRRRRSRPTPLAFREQATNRPRSAKKSLSGHKIPLTPRDYRLHGFEGHSPESYHSQRTNQSQESRDARQSTQIIEALEERITHLERQNKILQAALLAALDVGTKQSLESVLGGLTTPPATATPGTGRSFSSETSTSVSTRARKSYSRRSKKPPFRPESWIASPGSSRRGSYGTDDSANVQELEDMMEDLDLDWMSEKPEA
ncbi:uncharacterized protein BO66DRAFT_166482 [Aspergillus aculeatinus CBS 121060]|uniref:Uncharacterized protein n=1 Tax=Aspergillus aculeatinus CBS 121060 TaxID=1448322 RepID=A0ACD1GZP6_9EURO|nr:hypothetical protein BO66DRAFT_166482 [Aspergillus aculeatinus CBS 121060]RAH66773.1 hypothetical protein BO66DRAFT_166482 [Aspergillus aculeatinus CBS 121060]